MNPKIRAAFSELTKRPSFEAREVEELLKSHGLTDTYVCYRTAIKLTKKAKDFRWRNDKKCFERLES